jgi:hypothetical protein
MRQLTSGGTAPRLLLACLVAGTLGACDLGAFTVDTTTKVLVRAQPSLKMESDWDLAARGLPGTLKTIEGFWTVNPNKELTAILAEGFCQYGTGFVEDEWEQAEEKKDFDGMDYQAARATKMYLRCTNYALRLLGKTWQDNIFGETDKIAAMVKGAGTSSRTSMMWVAVGIASAVNMNKDKIEMVAQLPTAKMILDRVVELDAKSPPDDLMLRALPHVALGMIASALPPAMGGDPPKATAEFKKALEITGDKFLLARVFMARKVGVLTQDRKMFHDELMKVLATSPSIWPEQRLANEIAHRRARRYLKHEKELF